MDRYRIKKKAKNGHGGKRAGAGRPKSAEVFAESIKVSCPYCGRSKSVTQPKHKQEIKCTCGKVSIMPLKAMIPTLLPESPKEIVLS